MRSYKQQHEDTHHPLFKRLLSQVLLRHCLTLAGNVGDMSAKCRQYVKMSMNLGIFGCWCQHRNSPDTRFLCQKFTTLYPIPECTYAQDPMPSPKFFLPNFKVAVVAVAMVVAWQQRQQQLRRWQRWQRWTRVGGESGRQWECQLLHDGMQWWKRTPDNNTTTNQIRA